STDTYALGSVLYEMLVGEPPFAGSTAQAVLGKIIAGKSVSAMEERPSVPPNVDAAIRKALEKLPADRFTGAQDFARALTDAGFRHGEEAARLMADAGPGKLLGIAAIALLLGLSLGYGLRSGSEDPFPSPVAAHLQIVLPPGVSLPLDSDYPVLAVSPDGSRIVFVGESDGGRQLYSRLLIDSVSRPIPNTDGALQPFFSPDGEWIAFSSGSLTGGMLYKVASAGGAPVPMHTVTGPGVDRGAAWVSDTSLVNVGSPNSGLQVGVTRNGSVGRPSDWDSLTTASMPAAWPARVSGTADVIFARSSTDGPESDIALVSLESGEERTLINGAISPGFSPTGHLLFARGSVLSAIEYDAESGETTGPEQVVMRGVAMAGFDVSHYAVGGSVLAYVAGEEISRQSQLVWVDRNGEVVGILHEGRRYSDPRLSPDGERVAVTIMEGPGDVWLLDLSRNNLLQPLTRHPGEDGGPVWSPDGSSIALASEVGEDQGEMGPVLAWIPELGGPTVQLLFTPDFGAVELPTSWVPDGLSIVVTVRRPEGDRASIALFSLEGERQLVPLVVDRPGNEVGGRISPNGRWLAYVSDESGQADVWIRPFSRPGTSTQLSIEGGTEPVWSWDSSEIFYRSGLDMMVVEIPDALESVFSAPRWLFTGYFERHLFGGGAANYDVSRDGTRFLMVRRRERVRPTVINVVLNWPSILLPGQSGTP
ncbi:MAG: PD40 domain-containing protein, partial [Gemmatimonadetes bacterium]|nr:PD40 domain-containing protein [Gemmatimonadota bacterium]